MRTKKLLKLCEKKQPKILQFLLLLRLEEYHYNTVYTANTAVHQKPRALLRSSQHSGSDHHHCVDIQGGNQPGIISHPTYHDGSHPCIPAVRIPNCHYKRQRCSGKTTDGLAELVFQRVQRGSRRSVGLQQLYNILFYPNLSLPPPTV